MEKHILLIDDDKEDLPVFLEALNQLHGNYNCVQANDIIQAAKLVNHLHPDVIFMDYNMPGINGLDCLSAIQKTEELKYIPLYLYGNQASNKVLQYAMSLGAKALINRTRNSKLLAAILKKILPQNTNRYFQN